MKQKDGRISSNKFGNVSRVIRLETRERIGGGVRGVGCVSTLGCISRDNRYIGGKGLGQRKRLAGAKGPPITLSRDIGKADW